MRTPKQLPHRGKRQKMTKAKQVSFSEFRRLQGVAIRTLASYKSLEDMPIDSQFTVYAIIHALDRADYLAAVQLSKRLTEQQYGDAGSFRLAHQIAAMVKKVPYTNVPGLDPEAKARDRFEAAERSCAETNEVLREFNLWFDGRSTDLKLADDAERMFRLIGRAKVHVKRVIGVEPPLALISEFCRFSGGSVQGCSGNATHLAAKLSADDLTVTPGCWPYALSFMRANPYMWEALFGFPHHHATPADFERELGVRVKKVAYDKIDFVPKTAEVHRTIGKQASLNQYVQNGIGDFLREALLHRAHINIRTAQKAVNGRLAYLGSSCEGMPFVTLDLSSASDTISTEFVKCLVPPAWFDFLNATRSPGYAFGNEAPHRYHKFVAMGNGFCFALETLLFWALVQAVYDLNVVPDRRCAVYGDDIIVYQSVALELTELLNVCGFELNTEKSFIFGPFRESCGQDYFEGINVRPFILDEVVENWGQVYHMVNSFRRTPYLRVYENLKEMVPERYRFVRRDPGPSNTAIEVPQDEFLASRHTRWNRDLQAFEAKALLTVPIMDDADYCDNRYGMLAALLGHRPREDGRPSFALRYKTRTFTRWEAGV